MVRNTTKPKSKFGIAFLITVFSLQTAFCYPFQISKVKLMIRYVGNDMFELEIEGLLFSEAWNEVKSRNTFEWENKEKHDPYDVR